MNSSMEVTDSLRSDGLVGSRFEVVWNELDWVDGQPGEEDIEGALEVKDEGPDEVTDASQALFEEKARARF